MASYQKQYDAFLSHNAKDKTVVEKIGKWLQEHRQVRVWIDSSLVPGEPWQERIEQALEASHCCVVFIGRHGITPWQNEEIRVGIDGHVTDGSIRVVLVFLPDAGTEPADLAPFMRRLQCIGFRERWDEPG